jgi:hypothetical protein
MMRTVACAVTEGAAGAAVAFGDDEASAAAVARMSMAKA